MRFGTEGRDGFCPFDGGRLELSDDAYARMPKSDVTYRFAIDLASVSG